jgi:type I restriction-modification system DNA methylase subunit
MLKKEDVKKKISELVEKYRRDVASGKKYNEENTKNVFIRPLFKALGWDVDDSDEVNAEERVSRGRVDYAFRISGVLKFFLEAKPLRADLMKPEWAEQAIGYAYHKACTWAILTNFETLLIFNAEVKVDNPFQSQLKTINCEEFLERFDELWLLSRESFEQGLLDKEAERWHKKSKKIPIDKQLLADFTGFRELLSKNILKLNSAKNLTEEDVDESVQRILDRLIFIRNCEDRELENKKLLEVSRETSALKHLRELFCYYDKTYDSKLFTYDPSNPKKVHDCDTVKIDDDVLKDVITGLYRTKDKSVFYDFSAIEADVLGNIYEQYLGHILKKTPKRATVTESQAHRKAQGIYYTPTYIVDYIVRNTLGELLNKTSVSDIPKIKVLDPACGSGSFLIKAFDVICEAYMKKTKSDKVTFEQKRSILQNNIYGVDLDPKAVEIAQLNLLLKAAEKGKRLPMLENNIKCGNSLIDDEKVAGDRAFNWDKEFPDIMKKGGFDVVVGNPPYGIVFNEEEKHFIEEHLPSFRRNNDLYVAFIEKSVTLLNSRGFFSFIVPNTYLIGSYFDSMKKFILEKTRIIKILDFGTNQIFLDPNVFNSIIVLGREKDDVKRKNNCVEFYNLPSFTISDYFKLEDVANKTIITEAELSNLVWKPKNDIIEKIVGQKDKLLGDVCHVKDVGFNYWTVGRGKKRGGSIGSKVLYEGDRKSARDIPYLKGRDVIRYGYVFGNHWLRTDYKKFLDETIDIFRFTPEFLETSPKLIYRQTADRIIATVDYDKYYLDKTVHLIIPREKITLNLLSLLGVLNSKLMLYFYRDLVREEGRTFAQVKTVYIKKIPIKHDLKIEQMISDLVSKQLTTTKKIISLNDKQTDARAKLEAEIKKTDAEIDELVYKIYGITDKEKKIIEESLK